MCKASTELRFCTCSDEATDLEHYWTLYRFHEGPEVEVMGEMILPYTLDKVTDLHNRKLLLQRVNTPDAWDVDLKPRKGDRLAVTFTCGKGAEEGYVTYGFEYNGTKWVARKFHPFNWLSKHEEESSGEVAEAVGR